jgi:hypothetical protein
MTNVSERLATPAGVELDIPPKTADNLKRSKHFLLL